jgi:hypothetical protein
MKDLSEIGDNIRNITEAIEDDKSVVEIKSHLPELNKLLRQLKYGIKSRMSEVAKAEKLKKRTEELERRNVEKERRKVEKERRFREKRKTRHSLFGRK